MEMLKYAVKLKYADLLQTPKFLIQLPSLWGTNEKH